MVPAAQEAVVVRAAQVEQVGAAVAREAPPSHRARRAVRGFASLALSMALLSGCKGQETTTTAPATTTSLTLSLGSWVQGNGQALTELRSAGLSAIEKSTGSVRAGEGIGACEQVRGRLPGMLKRLPVPDARADSALRDALELYRRGTDQCVLARIRDDIPAMLTARDNLIRAENKMDELFGVLNARA